MRTDESASRCLIDMNPKIYIVGNNQLHYELISFCLENELKAQCEFQSEVSSIEPDEEETGLQRVWLIDCLDLDVPELKKRLNRFASLLPDNAMMALFNVDAAHKLENLVVQYKIRGLFYRSNSRDVFIKGLRTILNGHLWLSRKLLSDCILAPHDHGHPSVHGIKALSNRERAILQRVAAGASNQQIADKLSISVHTVKTHLYKIFRKINVPNRMQAALWINTCMMAFPNSTTAASSRGALDRKSKA
jgi:DNA-binding NarL/FixJ family response regulator